MSALHPWGRTGRRGGCAFEAACGTGVPGHCPARSRQCMGTFQHLLPIPYNSAWWLGWAVPGRGLADMLCGTSYFIHLLFCVKLPLISPASLPRGTRKQHHSLWERGGGSETRRLMPRSLRSLHFFVLRPSVGDLPTRYCLVWIIEREDFQYREGFKRNHLLIPAMKEMFPVISSHTSVGRR